MARRGTAASINLGDLEKLAALQCTDEEMGGFFGVSTRTIERRRKSPVFAQTIARGKARGRISLRRAQLKMVEDGSATMGIWLGKQHLGQTDEIQVNNLQQINVILLPSKPVSNAPEEQCQVLDIVTPLRLPGSSE
jgi:hypothetical protein